MIAVKSLDTRDFIVPAASEISDQHVGWKVTVKRCCFARVGCFNNVIAHFYQRQPKRFSKRMVRI